VNPSPEVVLQAGKLPFELLSEMLGRVETRDPRVVLGPKPGEDAALIDFGDRYLVATTDPITFATDLIGWYVVQVNANDLAVMGATPKWLMATLLLPEGTESEVASDVFDQLTDACRELEIDLIGGHTEITLGLPRPIAIGAMLGEVPKDRVVLSSGARPGDAVILTKGIAVEGTALLAREAPEALLTAGIGKETLDRASALLFDPGISVARDAAIALETVEVHAMHDPTEGGVATGLREMAAAGGVGMDLDMESIATLPECDAVCGAMGLDPLGLIASGSLLAAVPANDAPRLIEALAKEGIPAYDIGRITEAQSGLRMRTAAGEQPLPTFERDELARYFGRSANAV